MTYRELRRKLERLGCRFDRQASGSHEMWLNPTNDSFSLFGGSNLPSTTWISPASTRAWKFCPQRKGGQDSGFVFPAGQLDGAGLRPHGILEVRRPL